MVREGFQVRFEASSYYWRFAFGGRDGCELYCNLAPITEKKLEKQKHAYMLMRATAPRKLQGNIWEDVSVKIGRVYGPRWGEKIPQDNFENWVKVAMALNRPSEIIEISYGSLILEEKFSNKIFLKGLILEGQSKTENFKYGYDLRNGAVNRDRRVEAKLKENRILADIWGDAIAEGPGNIVSKYVDMLLDDQKWPDVYLAETRISGPTAKTIWDYLQARDLGQNKFYHDDKHGDKVCTACRY
jgi:hypothetical protein